MAETTLIGIGEDPDLCRDPLLRYARACDAEQTALEAWEMDGCPMHAVGSRGSLIVHPIAKAVRDAEAHAAKMARELGLSPSAVTQVSDRLERRGLLERVFQDEDRRVRKLRLTRKGQQLVRSREEKQFRRITAALNTLSKSEVDQIMTGFDILTRSCTPIESAEI